ncbi:MAG: hypothetical protein Q9M31_09685, partial [Mariprofundus sp.]|nr:hypothetical protein [Mariprofundus sp.]
SQLPFYHIRWPALFWRGQMSNVKWKADELLHGLFEKSQAERERADDIPEEAGIHIKQNALSRSGSTAQAFRGEPARAKVCGGNPLVLESSRAFQFRYGFPISSGMTDDSYSSIDSS